MNTTFRWVLVVTIAVVAGLTVFMGGVVFARSGWGVTGFGPSTMMAGYAPGSCGQASLGTASCGYGTTGSGMMGGGMMDGFTSSGLSAAKPLAIEEAETAVEAYLSALNDDDLALGELMIFDNHAYAQVIEESTGIGAFEALVDPATQAVFSEPGPNMMWNLKYGHMGGLDGFGMNGMMGGPAFQTRGGMMAGPTVADISPEMPVTAEEAVEVAQNYLDSYLPGAEAEDAADAFYGYYTIHILREDQTVGMLSVNGYTRQVFPHTWHGDFVEMQEHEG
jgi:hypothetical protein